MALLKETCQEIGSLDMQAMESVRGRLDSLTKPVGSLGILEDLAIQLAGISGETRPRIIDKWVVVMAGDHGVAAEGVSAYPPEVTAQMVINFLSGGAAINVLARHADARVRVVDLGIASDLNLPGLVAKKVRPGTASLARGMAMSRAEAVGSLEAGIEVAFDLASRGASVIATGDMGIGNTTPSSAIVAAFTGRSPEEVVGRGTGVDDARLAAKIEAIRQGLVVNKPDANDALDVLAKVGGLEIGGLAGLVLGAAARRIPVVIDGFISGAAALVAARLAPAARPYLIASHLSVEPGHRIVLDELGLVAPLQLRARLGEGTGAVLAFALLEAACRITSQMATFGEASVSGEEG